jgi:hypothetical protein
MPAVAERLSKASHTPARDRVKPFLPRALAEGWSAAKLADEAGVSRGVASVELRAASAQVQRSVEAKLSGEVNRAVAVAREVRDGQIEQARRIEALSEKAIAGLEVKAKAGELSIRDLETLTRLRERHWLHVKDLSGVAMAEKLALAKAKGDATGRGFAGALLDATAIDIGAGVWEASSDNESDDWT